MHVNLILDAERRSASPVPMTTLIRLVFASLVLLLLLAAFSIFSGFRNLQREVRGAREDWHRSEPKYEAAIKLRNDLALQKSILDEITGWQKARLEWGRQLEVLQKVVPASVQMTDLRVGQLLLVLTNNAAGRVFEMRLAGRTGEASGADVDELRQAFTNQPPFVQVVEEAVIPPGAFKQDPTHGASRNDRVFEIVCRCKPRKFE
jgi:hypothetical protein